jgi:hypothetical protein
MLTRRPTSSCPLGPSAGFRPWAAPPAPPVAAAGVASSAAATAAAAAGVRGGVAAGTSPGVAGCGLAAGAAGAGAGVALGVAMRDLGSALGPSRRSLSEEERCSLVWSCCLVAAGGRGWGEGGCPVGGVGAGEGRGWQRPRHGRLGGIAGRALSSQDAWGCWPWRRWRYYACGAGAWRAAGLLPGGGPTPRTGHAGLGAAARRRRLCHSPPFAAASGPPADLGVAAKKLAMLLCLGPPAEAGVFAFFMVPMIRRGLVQIAGCTNPPVIHSQRLRSQATCSLLPRGLAYARYGGVQRAVALETGCVVLYYSAICVIGATF